MADIWLPKNAKKLYAAHIKNFQHFYRDVAIVMSITGIREICARYQAPAPKGERLN
jgi:hypothetical protein